MVYDCTIIGAGTAGLSAAVYMGRERAATVMIDPAFAGGQLGDAGLIEFYPGFPDGIEGSELSARLLEQATKNGVELMLSRALSIEKEGDFFRLRLENGDQVTAKTVIAATGSSPKKLGVPGEEKFLGKGVSYCAVCDGAFFKNKRVFVVGGGDAAIDEALFLTQFSKVTVVHRRDALRACRFLQERAFANEQLSFLWNSQIREIEGNEKVEKVIIERSGKTEEILADGIFVCIGRCPNSYIFGKLPGIVADGGCVMGNLQMKTGVDGLFVAGDLRAESARQIGAAVGDGVTAAMSVLEYLNNR